MNTVPNEIENTKLYELFLAVYFNDLEKVIDFKNRYPELYAMKNNFQIGGHEENMHSFDLMNLTFFNQVIWFDDCWIDEIKPFVERRRQQTTQMLDFWRIEFSKQDIQRTIEYNQCWDCFYCENPSVTNEMSYEPIQDYVDKGYRKIDLMLYNRAECFDFVETKKLLELGANPNITFYENEEDKKRDDGYNILDRIGSECSYLTSCEVIPVFKTHEEKGFYPYSGKENVERLFGDLIGLAAHEEMYGLLKPYSKEE